MKKIAFVLYTNQLLSASYLGGFPTTKPLEKDLKKVLEDEYEITFHWEAAVKNRTVDAIVIPDPFPPVLNEEKLPEIKVPANLFLNKEVQKIKNMIDSYFNN